MTKEREALRMALEALEARGVSMFTDDTVVEDAITAIREVLAQPEQSYPDNFIDALKYDVAKRDSEAQPKRPAVQGEPVAWDNCRNEYQCRSWCGNSSCASHFENTTPQPAERKPLSMQERTSIVRANKSFHDKNEIDAYGIIDDVEAAHGIKENT